VVQSSTRVTHHRQPAGESQLTLHSQA